MVLVEPAKADLCRGALLGAHIDRAGGIIADQNGGKTRNDAMLGLEPSGLLRDPRPQPQGDCLAVYDSRGHLGVPRRERSEGLHSASIIFRRDAAPDTIRTLDLPMPNVLARRRISASFALPSSGGAETRAFRVRLPSGSWVQPSTQSRPPFGVSRTAKRILVISELTSSFKRKCRLPASSAGRLAATKPQGAKDRAPPWPE